MTNFFYSFKTYSNFRIIIHKIWKFFIFVVKISKKFKKLPFFNIFASIPSSNLERIWAEFFFLTNSFVFPVIKWKNFTRKISWGFLSKSVIKFFLKKIFWPENERICEEFFFRFSSIFPRRFFHFLISQKKVATEFEGILEEIFWQIFSWFFAHFLALKNFKNLECNYNCFC